MNYKSVMLVDQGGYTVPFLLKRYHGKNYYHLPGWTIDIDNPVIELDPAPAPVPAPVPACRKDTPVDLTDFLETTAGLMLLCEMAHVPYEIPTWYGSGGVL